MPTKIVPWDSSAVLRSNDEIATYIDAVLEDGDPMLLAHARRRGTGERHDRSR
jgi:DNA-binding phage protein